MTVRPETTGLVGEVRAARAHDDPQVAAAAGLGGRVDFYDDPGAPAPVTLVPVAFAMVRDPRGLVLLVRRVDTGNWELPGGRVEVGESAGAAVVREVGEETGLVVRVRGLVGLFTSPRHVVAYPGGEIRQQFGVCFHARPVGGRLRPDGTVTDAARWFRPGELDGLRIHPSVRLRITHALTHPHSHYLD